jgi:Cysteine-rich secretory protein family
MTRKVKIVGAFSICTVFTTSLGTVAGFAARADDLGTAMYSGVSRLRQTCGVIGDDPRLTLAAQRHADDMLKNGVGGHIGSDGSSPRARITDAGYVTTSYTGEIVYWGTGSAATPSIALDSWMGSPAHRAIILNCAFTAAGFATASDGNKMTAVGDFAGP